MHTDRATSRVIAHPNARTHLVDVATDVHALGALAYVCASGRAPFDGGSLQAILFRVITADPEPLHQLDGRIPLAASDVVARRSRRRLRTDGPARERWPTRSPTRSVRRG